LLKFWGNVVKQSPVQGLEDLGLFSANQEFSVSLAENFELKSEGCFGGFQNRSADNDIVSQAGGFFVGTLQIHNGSDITQAGEILRRKLKLVQEDAPPHLEPGDVVAVPDDPPRVHFVEPDPDFGFVIFPKGSTVGAVREPPLHLFYVAMPYALCVFTKSAREFTDRKTFFPTSESGMKTP